MEKVQVGVVIVTGRYMAKNWENTKNERAVVLSGKDGQLDFLLNESVLANAHEDGIDVLLRACESRSKVLRRYVGKRDFGGESRVTLITRPSNTFSSFVFFLYVDETRIPEIASHMTGGDSLEKFTESEWPDVKKRFASANSQTTCVISQINRGLSIHEKKVKWVRSRFALQNNLFMEKMAEIYA